MGDEDLQRLVWRRLFELGLTQDEASERSRNVLSKEALRGFLEGRQSGYVSDRVARALARALDVSEHRVRRAAELPVSEPHMVATKPHLWVVSPSD